MPPARPWRVAAQGSHTGRAALALPGAQQSPLRAEGSIEYAPVQTGRRRLRLADPELFATHPETFTATADLTSTVAIASSTAATFVSPCLSAKRASNVAT